MPDPDDSPSSADPVRTAEFAAALAELQNLLLADSDLREVLAHIARLAAGIAAETACGITLRRDGEITTVASSDGFALEVDEIQYGTGQGPCLQSMADDVEIYVADLAADDRWGEYRDRAVACGVRSSLSMPLKVDVRRSVRSTCIRAPRTISTTRYVLRGSATSPTRCRSR